MTAPHVPGSTSVHGKMTRQYPPHVIPCESPCGRLCDFQDIGGPCWGQVEPHQDLSKAGNVVHCCQAHSRFPYGGVYQAWKTPLCTLGAALEILAKHGGEALEKYDRHVFHCTTCSKATGHDGSVTKPLDVAKIEREQIDG